MKNLSDKMLQVVLAVLAESAWQIVKPYQETYQGLFDSALEEMKARDLSRVNCESNIVPRLGVSHSERYAKEEECLAEDIDSYDASIFNDEELLLLAGVGAFIADFSMLGRGIRTLNDVIWLKSRDEMDKRKLEFKFLCDLEYEYGR
jgi:hypothetical protein